MKLNQTFNIKFYELFFMIQKIKTQMSGRGLVDKKQTVLSFFNALLNSGVNTQNNALLNSGVNTKNNKGQMQEGVKRFLGSFKLSPTDVSWLSKLLNTTRMNWSVMLSTSPTSKSEPLSTKLKQNIVGLLAILLFVIISTIAIKSGLNEHYKGIAPNTMTSDGVDDNDNSDSDSDSDTSANSSNINIQQSANPPSVGSTNINIPQSAVPIVKSILKNADAKIKTVGDTVNFLPSFMSEIVDRVPVLTTGRGLVLLSAIVSIIGFSRFWPEIKTRYQLLQKKSSFSTTNPSVKVVSKKPHPHPHHRSKNNKKKR
jgi:hypothetical protein